jgi:hypothetical protein
MSDFAAPAIDVSELYGDDGWPVEPSRIFFGADDGTIIKDFSVVVQAPGGAADFDGDSDTDGADFLTWQRGLGTMDNAIKATGDANGDMDVNGADLEVWRGDFGSTTGAATAVPEAASIILAAVAMTALAGSRRRH